MSDDQTTDFAGEVGKLRVLMEQVLHEVQATNEGVGVIQEQVDTLATKKQVAELADKAEIIQKAVTATNRDVTNLDHRVIRLEAA